MGSQAEKKQHKERTRRPSHRQDARGAKRSFSWRPFAVAGCIIVIAIALLYPVGRDFYKTMRHEQRLQAQYDAVLERNDAVQAENDALQTPEGIENQAHTDLGWVQPGEEAAVVTNQEGSVDYASRLPEKQDVESIHAPTSWYYSVLDALFFVHE